MRAWFALAALWLAPPAQSWELSKRTPIVAAPGVSTERQEWRDPAGGSAELHVVRFDGRTHRLRVIDQGADGRAALAETLAPTDALAGINGGYFHPDRRPLGLVVAETQTIHPQEKARLLSGLLLVQGNGAMYLQRPGEPRRPLPVTDALQAGPFLVDRGLPVEGLEATRRARRSVVLVDARGQWSLISTSRLTLAETAALLATSGIAGEAKVVRALNLDGGSSTALWVRGAKPESPPAVAITEFGTVRNFLAVVPRNSAR